MALVPCAIAGYGRIGRMCHQLITAHPDLGLRVVAVADTPADIPGILTADVEAVLIATPPASHFEIARDSLAAGKHVYVEKPPASTLVECEELIELQKHSCGILFFAFHAIYNESVEYVRKAIAGRPVDEIHASYLENVLNWHDATNWVHAEGVLRDSGVNALSVIRHLLPRDAPFRIVSSKLAGPEGQGETQADVRFTFGEAGAGSLHMDWTHSGVEVRTISVRAGSDEFVIDISRDALTYNGGTAVAGSDGDLLPREYERMLRHFAECIRSGVSSHSCWEMRFLECVV